MSPYKGLILRMCKYLSKLSSKKQNIQLEIEKNTYSDNQFKEFLNENPQFDQRKFDLWHEEGEFSGILILKKWGHHP